APGRLAFVPVRFVFGTRQRPFCGSMRLPAKVAVRDPLLALTSPLLAATVVVPFTAKSLTHTTPAGLANSTSLQRVWVAGGINILSVCDVVPLKRVRCVPLGA